MTTLTSNLPDGSVVGGRLRRFRAVVTLATQGQTAHSLGLRIPPGHTFAFGMLTTSVTLGSSTVAIGTSGTAGKYRAAATFTTANAPTLFGVATAVGATSGTTGTVGSSPKGTGTDEDIIMTVAAADLPSSGTLVVDLYYSAT